MSDVIELDAAAIEAIAKQVAAPEINQDEIAQKVVEKMTAQAEAAKQAADKENNKLKSDNKAVEGEVVSKYAKMSKEEFAVKQLAAALEGKAQEFNTHALKTLKEAGLVEKATYLNAGTTADGGAFVPNAELLKDIFTVLPKYSSIANLGRTITLTDGDSLDLATLTADVVMTEVGTEGGSKTVTKPTIGDANISVREFAGIALMTKKLLRQSALDVYAVIRDSFARAIAKQKEQLALTDSTSGIVSKTGVVVNTLASTKVSVDDITWADIKAMPFAVPTSSANGGEYVISRLLAGHLDSLQDSQGRDLDVITWDGELTGRFKNGYRFRVAETLGTTDAVSTVHAVFGNWNEYMVRVVQGAVDSQVFDSGTVTDGSSVVHNLIQENKLAMRVEDWENVGFPVPGAFVRLRTAAS